jgi:hypothetical protein
MADMNQMAELLDAYGLGAESPDEKQARMRCVSSR